MTAQEILDEHIAKKLVWSWKGFGIEVKQSQKEKDISYGTIEYTR
jgi:hypothetical protein